MPIEHKPLKPILSSCLFIANPETGEIFRRYKNRYKQVGKPKGPLGYGQIMYDYQNYEAHRIAWALYHDQDPGIYMVDHIDQNPRNNRKDNLRLATHSENMLNNAHSHIRLDKGGSWLLRMTFDGKVRCKNSVNYQELVDLREKWLHERKNQPRHAAAHS